MFFDRNIISDHDANDDDDEIFRGAGDPSVVDLGLGSPKMLQQPPSFDQVLMTLADFCSYIKFTIYTSRRRP